MLLWLPHQPSPYKGWYKLINLIRGCDCGCDYRGWKGREGWRDKAERDGSWRWGFAGSEGPGNDELGGVGEEPRCSACLMRKTRKLQSFLPGLLSVLHLFISPVLYFYSPGLHILLLLCSNFLFPRSHEYFFLPFSLSTTFVFPVV